MANHVAAVNDIYACFASGDVPGILDRLDPEIE